LLELFKIQINSAKLSLPRVKKHIKYEENS